jgi:hypothetical protein
MTTSNCPECGSEATEESILKERLSDLGYRHTDTTFACSECDNRWVIGQPHGGAEKPEWECKSCGGELVPHFLFVTASDRKIRTRPKCRECYHVPDRRIELNSKFNGENIRGFVGHPAVTGEETEESFPL